MNKETLRMQFLSGVITESEYKAKLNENRTAEELFQMFKDEDLLNDRREYDIEDLMSAYPDLSQEEAKKLEKMLQKDSLNEQLRMQFLSGVITESEYKAKLAENQNVNNIVKNLSSTYDLSTFESFKDEIESSDLMDEIITQMNGGVEPDYNNMDQDEINNLVNPIKKQVDDYVFEKFNKKIFNKTSSSENKDSLNEHYVAGGIVGIGAINQIPSRAKADYEDAFEHFLSQKYDLKENEDDMPEAPSHEETDASQVYEEKINENYNPNRMLELIEMYVDNYSDEGMSAEAAIKKIDQLLQGNLDGYDEAFMAGKEDQY